MELEGWGAWVLWVGCATHCLPSPIERPRFPTQPLPHPAPACPPCLQLWGPHISHQLVGSLLIFQFDELKILSTLLLLMSQEGIKSTSDPIKCH